MIFITTGTVLLFGYVLSGLLLPNAKGTEKLSLGFILGVGIFTLLWFLINLTGIPLTLLSGLILLLVLILLLLGISKLTGRRSPLKSKFDDLKYFQNMTIFEKVLFFTILFLFFSSFVGDLYLPVRHWDSLTLYDFRAKVFTQTGFVSRAVSYGGFFGYPLLTSLMHTFIYLAGYNNPSFLYSFYYISFIILFYINLKKLKLKRIIVLTLTFIAAVSPLIFDHSLSAYTNLPYSIYLVCGSMYLYFGFRNKDIGTILMSALLVGLSTWTRSAEPFWLSCFLVIIIYSLIQKKWLWPLYYTLMFLSVMLPWRFFLSFYNAGTANVAGQVVLTATSIFGSLNLISVIPALKFVIVNVVYPYLGYFLLMFLVITQKCIERSTNWLFASLMIFNLGLLFGGVLVFSQYEGYWQEIPDSLTRMTMFIPPMIVFLCANHFSKNKLINK